ncbi:MAG: alpha-galactosidase [Dermatophilaceae bacterium]
MPASASGVAGGTPATPSGLPHLRGGGVSLALDLRGHRPQVLYWGPDLGPGADLEAVALGLVPAVAHSAPDTPRPRPLLPMPVDGWPMRPALVGARPDGTGWSPDLRPSRPPRRDRDPDRVQLRLADASAGLVLDLALTLDEHGVLAIDQRVTNLGPDVYRLDRLAAVLPLPDTAREILDLTGRWSRERTPQRHPLPLGAWCREGRHGRTGHDAPLLLAVGTPGFGFEHGEVYAVHLAWSADSVLWAERGPMGRSQIGAGELLGPGEVVLAPTEEYAAPTVLAAMSTAGLNGLSDAWHGHVRARPGHPQGPRPVTFNTWEAVYFDHRADRLRELADRAAQLGVERFVLDDGWFGARRDDTAGLGDWVVSGQVWPHGLAPLVEHVRALGMQFGLWVEPEMVNPDSDLYRAHPDWVLGVPGREPPTWRHQLALDLGRPEVRDHLVRRLGDLLAAYDIGFLKWDHNRDLLDAAGYDGRPGVRATTLGAYDVLDRLRAAFPRVQIESCASGGGRVDLGILARTDRVWASDCLDPLERVGIQLWTGLLVPPELVGAHIGAARSHTTGRRHDLSLRAAAAVFGHLGIEWDLTSMTPDEFAELAGVVATYREWRALLHGGRVHRVDHPDPSAVLHGVVARDRSEAVFALVQTSASDAQVPAPLRLTGLDPDRAYRVTAMPLAGGPDTQQVAPPPWLAEGLTATGRALALVGVAPPILRPEQALLLVVRAQGAR